jgi:carbamoyl-phosphate synthase large subunit
MGGQTGLNLAVDLASHGTLEEYNVRLLGTPLDAIKKAEDRELFRQLLIDIDEPVPPSVIVNSWEAAKKAADNLGLPLIIRPAYTLGGTGGGMAKDLPELEDIVKAGLSASPINQILLERSLVGWKELEYEVIRDRADNCITVCNMENLDPMGVHTGDSIVVAPSQTLTDKEHQLLRSASLKIIRALGIEGGCNVQFALAPNPIIAASLPENAKPSTNLDYYVIEVNPRVSRSSALASKATGYPIARVAAKIAIGRTLDQIPNAVTKKTTAAFEPALDYCVVKIPRWPFDKFPHGDRTLGTQMKATGEVMAIDRSFEAALQKAVRSLEFGHRSLVWEAPEWNSIDRWEEFSLKPSDLRLWELMAALRRGATSEDISILTGIDLWFVNSLHRIEVLERRLLKEDLTPDLLLQTKRMGFSDEHISVLADRLPERVRSLRKEWNIWPVYKMVDTCAAEFEAVTPYFYSTYESENEALPLTGPKSVVLGSGPIRIGQGIEFDYCSVHASWALQESGVKSIIINSNPETVSTDFDTSDRLYFEPLDEEGLMDVLDNEQNVDDEMPLVPSLVQFGGQTAINLSQALAESNRPVMGSTPQAIDIASDRRRFEDFLSTLGIPQPPGAAVNNLDDALQVAENVGYPVLVRPSYVLGGRAMEIVQNREEMKNYGKLAIEAAEGRDILVDKYFEGKECEVDAICDGESVLIPGIMEHIERAGVHSGDSMAIYPPINLTRKEIDVLADYTKRIGLALKINGLMNIQFVIVGVSPYRSPNVHRGEHDFAVYVIEVNPRSSRTVPFLSKVSGIPIVRVATKVMLGNTLKSLGYEGGVSKEPDLVAVKAPVFSMSKLSGVDTFLGPEMKSTGEVMGIDFNFHAAMAKALIASGMMLPNDGAILLSISDKDKKDAESLIRDIHEFGYKLFATEGTAEMIHGLGLSVTMITKKLSEGHPNVRDVISEGLVNVVVNTASGDRTPLRDGFEIRRTAVEKRIPCFTALDTARAAVEILTKGSSNFEIRPRTEYLNRN